MTTRSVSRKWAQLLTRQRIGKLIPLVFLALGMVMSLLYISGMSRDGGLLGFGIANLLLALYLFTVRGFQLLTDGPDRPRSKTNAAARG